MEETTILTVTDDLDLFPETTTTTLVTDLVEEQVTLIRSDLDLICGLLVAFMVIELVKWCYRFFNIFFPI